MKHLALMVGLAVVALGAAVPAAQASYVITISQDGADVVATGTGSLDLTGMSPAGTVNWESFVQPGSGRLSLGARTTERYYGAFSSSTSSFGTGGFTDATSGSGTTVIISSGSLYVAASYVSGTAMSATSTWANTTLSALGLSEGTYAWTLPSDDTLSVVIGGQSTAVPEPASLTLLGIPAAFTLLRRRRSVV